MAELSRSGRAPEAPAYVPGAAKGRILRARDVDLVPFLEKDVDETYRSWLLDDEVVEFLEVRQMDRSMPALNAYVRGYIDDPNRYFYLIVDRASSRRIGTASRLRPRTAPMRFCGMNAGRSRICTWTTRPGRRFG